LLPPTGGFTLVELLLALALMVLLIGLAAVGAGVWRGRGALEEGAERLETALRMARADAANHGRRVRLDFGPDGKALRVLWEPKPLEEPGRFVEWAACTWCNVVALDGARVDECRVVGESIYRAADWAKSKAPAGDAALETITFEPDGSSDSVTIQLSAGGADDSRLAAIDLDGVTGAITHRIGTAEQLAPQAEAP